MYIFEPILPTPDHFWTCRTCSIRPRLSERLWIVLLLRLLPRRGNADSEFSIAGFKIDSTEDSVIPQDQNQCPLFSAVPVEIRHMIFHHLLTTTELIEKPHKHLGSKETALLDNYKPIPQIDSAILRTCRMIYSEALPILYGQNTFEFSTASAIRSFQSKSLIGYPLGRASQIRRYRGRLNVMRSTEGDQVAFNLKSAPMGRLTLLRSVISTYFPSPYFLFWTRV